VKPNAITHFEYVSGKALLNLMTLRFVENLRLKKSSLCVINWA